MLRLLNAPPNYRFPDPRSDRDALIAATRSCMVRAWDDRRAPQCGALRAHRSRYPEPLAAVRTGRVGLRGRGGGDMAECRAVRKSHSIIEICKNSALAAEVTITAAEFLGVEAAIIFADLLLPLEVMGLPFHFAAGEGPKIERP